MVFARGEEKITIYHDEEVERGFARSVEALYFGTIRQTTITA